MDADAKRLKKLAKTMREAGILHYKCQEFEIMLSEKRIDIPDEIPRGTFSPSLQDNSPEMPSMRNYTEDEILLWSTGAMTPEQLEAK